MNDIHISTFDFRDFLAEDDPPVLALDSSLGSSILVRVYGIILIIAGTAVKVGADAILVHILAFWANTSL